MVSVMTAAPLSHFQAAVIVLFVSFYAFVCMFMVYFRHQIRAGKGFSCCHGLLYIHYFSAFLADRNTVATFMQLSFSRGH